MAQDFSYWRKAVLERQQLLFESLQQLIYVVEEEREKTAAPLPPPPPPPPQKLPLRTIAVQTEDTPLPPTATPEKTPQAPPPPIDIPPLPLALDVNDQRAHDRSRSHTPEGMLGMRRESGNLNNSVIRSCIATPRRLEEQLAASQRGETGTHGVRIDVERVARLIVIERLRKVQWDSGLQFIGSILDFTDECGVSALLPSPRKVTQYLVITETTLFRVTADFAKDESFETPEDGEKDIIFEIGMECLVSIEFFTAPEFVFVTTEDGFTQLYYLHGDVKSTSLLRLKDVVLEQFSSTLPTLANQELSPYLNRGPVAHFILVNTEEKERKREERINRGRAFSATSNHHRDDPTDVSALSGSTTVVDYDRRVSVAEDVDIAYAEVVEEEEESEEEESEKGDDTNTPAAPDPGEDEDESDGSSSAEPDPAITVTHEGDKVAEKDVKEEGRSNAVPAFRMNSTASDTEKILEITNKLLAESPVRRRDGVSFPGGGGGGGGVRDPTRALFPEEGLRVSELLSEDASERGSFSQRGSPRSPVSPMRRSPVPHFMMLGGAGGPGGGGGGGGVNGGAESQVRREAASTSSASPSSQASPHSARKLTSVRDMFKFKFGGGKKKAQS